MEEWKNIQGYDNYQISNYGRVKNVKSGKLLSQSLRNEYPRVGLFSSPNQRSFDVHRLVAEHFLPPPSIELIETAQNTKHKKVLVNHKDGNKTNNHINNLEWIDYHNNMKHSYEIGIRKILNGETHYISKLTEKDVLEIRKIYIEQNGRHGIYSELSIKYNVSNETIRSIIKRKTWKHI